MQMQAFRHRAVALAVGVALLALSGGASADPPSRVARLGYMSGAVSFSPAGENDWDPAVINRPLGPGDRLWTEQGARAEIQVGGALIRMSAATSVAVSNLDDRITQLQLTQGTLNVRVRRLGPDQVVEVDTPHLAFALRQPGAYRIAVDPDGYATTIVVHQGQGEVFGERAAYVIDSRQAYRFTGTGLREFRYVEAPRLDDFDRWASDRDRALDNSASARYVSPDVLGYQDLDANGYWRADAAYGNVWIPNRVSAGWVPYRDGHWAWIRPWGWTWVDDAPWGFAVSHYGRWANFGGTWAWVPGPLGHRAYYAPALVVFVGGNNFQLAIASGNVGAVGWFPLAPREVYRPAYPVSRGYFERINRSNTVINNTVIYNTYNTTNVSHVSYANQGVPGAVVAVPTSAFVQSQPVSTTSVRVSRELLANAALANVAPLTPTAKPVPGGAASGDNLPARAFGRPGVVRSAPATPHIGVAVQREPLTLRPRDAPLQAAPAVPPIPPAQSPEPRGRLDPRGRFEQRGQTLGPPSLAASAPGLAAQVAPARQVTPMPDATPTASKPRPAASKPMALDKELDAQRQSDENRRQKR